MFFSVTSRLIFPSTPAERKSATETIGGPIAMTSFFVEMTRLNIGWQVLAIVVALIHISLAVFNILPLPALDGGRAVMILLNILGSLFRKKYILISESTEAYVHSF
jgi:membrane-associated protease RseP (regulator of RpoE activity)